MPIERYRQKRDFSKTPEPKGRVHIKNNHLFVIQKHAASHLHYDFRLELDGVLKSWAVPKGPCLDPNVKRLAIETEDHPIEYGSFEGVIPKGQYGGGEVLLWDNGTWEPLDDDPNEAYQKGHLRFILHAHKLGGRWDLFKIDDKNSWFLKKYVDNYAKSLKDYDITLTLPKSVVSGQLIEDMSTTQKKTAKNNLDLPVAPFPETLAPQLATLTDKAPKGDDWVHEIKFDGYRMLAFKKGKTVRMMSRNNLDWTDKFQSIADDIKKLPIDNAVFDGEMVVLDENNHSSFQMMQNSLEAGTQAHFIYYIFDLTYYRKWDIKNLPLLERKALLEPLIPTNSNLRYSDHIVGHGDDVFKSACKLNFEGIISKQAKAPYVTRRSKSWLKVKCIKRQEFIIGGFTPPQHSRQHFGSLFLGYFNTDNELIFSGNVGTGFSSESLSTIYRELEKRIISQNPFNSKPPKSTHATWVKPELVAEIEFTEWTHDGHLRHPSFKGLRWDKKAKDIIKEKEIPVEPIEKKLLKPSKQTMIKLTHPEKIIYPEDKITKEQLFNYYDDIAETMLPYLKNRPLSLVRCPSDYTHCFYQKHVHASSKFFHAIPIASKKNETTDYTYIDDKEGLLSLIQMGVMEIHPWGSTIDHLDYPDILVFDLDPAPDVGWKEVVDAAFLLKKHLLSLKLQSFIKTTGGKGLHVVIPIKPEHTWDIISPFTHAFVETIEQLHPEKYVSTMSKSKREGKIFIDYLRNQRDATAIGAYSSRARIHAPVATPIDWDELTDDIKDTSFNIFTLPERLKQLKKDPWEDFWKIGKKQSLKIIE